MTVSTTSSRVEYLGNGSTLAFTVPFYFLANADLRVYQAGTLKTLTTHYSVSGAGTPAGGTVTFVAAPGNAETVVIFRDPAITQETDYISNDPFPAESHERALDKLTMIAQRIGNQIDRAVTLADGSAAAVNLDLPDPEAGNVIGWNQSESGLQNYDASYFASVAAFSDWKYNTFTGDGTTATFALTASPASLANIDVSIDGVTQVPVADFSLSGASLIFTSAPPAASVVLARYGNALAQGTYAVRTERQLATALQTVFTLTTASYVPGGDHLSVFVNGVRMSSGVDYTETSATSVTMASGLALNDEVVFVIGRVVSDAIQSSNVGFLQAGTGAASRSVQSALRDRVSVKDYGATGNGVTDDVIAIQAAFDANPNATVLFPAGTYICSASIVLTNASGKNFQGSIVGDNAAITFTNAGSSSNADSAMQRGFAAYPTLNGTGGDISAMRKVQISGLDITGPTNGASIYLANCQDVTLRDVRTTTNRYGVVTECCINTGFYDCVFEDYTNAGVGLLMLSDTARVWYGSAFTPLLTYWNDSPLFEKCNFKNSLLTQPLAHILDHGSMAESVRSIGGCLLYSRWDGAGSFISTQYGILARNAQWHSFGSNWTENVSYPIRILEESSIEGTGNVLAVAGAQPAGTYSLTNFPNGYSYSAQINGWWFSRAFEAINVSGVRGVAYVGGNVNQLMQNGGVHLKSISTSSSGRVIDGDDSIVSPAGSYTYSSFVNARQIKIAAQWQDWTPVFTATSGTITTYTVNSAKYLQRGKEIQIRLDVTITTNGTAASAITSTLPINGVGNGGVLAGRENTVTGKMLQGRVQGAVLTILNYDNTYPGGNGARIIMSGVYEAA